ncbi:MAG: 50S ribosomal protein L29 [Candidatus Diapherotrites archaeon]|nr:50S ribosomal protein L29 [Candidatus Diapherotrites archaeon]
MRKKTAQLRDLSVQEIESQMAETKSNLAREKSLGVSGQKAEKPTNIRMMRRQIARMLTILEEKRGGRKKDERA